MKPISLAQTALMKTKRGMKEANSQQASQSVQFPLRSQLSTPHHHMHIVQLRPSTPCSVPRQTATGCQAPNSLVRGVNLALWA